MVFWLSVLVITVVVLACLGGLDRRARRRGHVVRRGSETYRTVREAKRDGRVFDNSI